MTHICVSYLTIIGLDNGLSHGRRQAIIWTDAGILLTGPLETNFSGILIYIFIQENAFERFFVKWKPFCLGVSVLNMINKWLL